MWIRRGITRTVWVTRKYAIKFPSLRSYGDGIRGTIYSFCRGYLANQSELTWQRNGSDPALCPILRSWLWGIIQFYPRCQPVPEDLPESEYPKPHYRFPGDMKPSNLGILDGKYVWLDYDMSYNGCHHEKSGVLTTQPSRWDGAVD